MIISRTKSKHVRVRSRRSKNVSLASTTVEHGRNIRKQLISKHLKIINCFVDASWSNLKNSSIFYYIVETRKMHPKDS